MCVNVITDFCDDDAYYALALKVPLFEGSIPITNFWTFLFNVYLSVQLLFLDTKMLSRASNSYLKDPYASTMNDQ